MKSEVYIMKKSNRQFTVFFIFKLSRKHFRVGHNGKPAEKFESECLGTIGACLKLEDREDYMSKFSHMKRHEIFI